MDAVKFIKERARMCDSLFGCEGCPANSQENGLGECFVGIKSKYAPEQQIEIVDKWSKEHPRKTRQSVFLEQYPEAQIDDTDVLCVCPAVISPSYRKDGGGCLNIHKKCANCRYEFWTKVVDAQPSVNVTGIARGSWTDITRINDGERMIATCSCCKDRGDVRTTKTGLGLWKLDSPYCPNCGVKMQEVE